MVVTLACANSSRPWLPQCGPGERGARPHAGRDQGDRSDSRPEGHLYGDPVAQASTLTSPAPADSSLARFRVSKPVLADIGSAGEAYRRLVANLSGYRGKPKGRSVSTTTLESGHSSCRFASPRWGSYQERMGWDWPIARQKPQDCAIFSDAHLEPGGEGWWRSSGPQWVKRLFFPDRPPDLHRFYCSSGFSSA